MQTARSNNTLTPNVIIVLAILALMNTKLRAGTHVESQIGLTNDNPCEQFKQFISSPPRIKGIRYQKSVARNLAIGIVSTNLIPTQQDATVGYHYARWQPDCSFLKSGPVDVSFGDEKREGEEVQARFHDSYWRVDPAGFVTSWFDTVHDQRGTRLQPTRFFDHRLEELSQVMNMGIMHLDIGTGHWNGNNFTAIGYTPEMKMTQQITGVLECNDEGYPRMLKINYLNHIGVYHYEIRYDYGTNPGLSFIPSSISAYFLPDTRSRIELMHWTIFSIELSTTTLNRALFERTSIVGPDAKPALIYTNNSWFAKNAFGKLSVVPEGFSNPKRIPYEHWKDHGLYYGAVGITSAIAFSSVWRITRKTKKEVKT